MIQRLHFLTGEDFGWILHTTLTAMKTLLMNARGGGGGKLFPLHLLQKKYAVVTPGLADSLG